MAEEKTDESAPQSCEQSIHAAVLAELPFLPGEPVRFLRMTGSPQNPHHLFEGLWRKIFL